MWHKTNHSPTLGGVLILTGKNISRMADFKQFCCSIDYCQNTGFNARFLRDRLLQESPRFPQDSVSQDYYKNQGDSRKIQSSGTNQERIMKPERIGNGTPPMENETPPVENERHPTDGKCYPTDGNI